MKENPDVVKMQKAALREVLERGTAFDEMVRTKGWKIVEGYFEERVKSFTSGLLLSDKPIEDFRDERYELKGIRGILQRVNSDIEAMKNDRGGDKNNG